MNNNFYVLAMISKVLKPNKSKNELMQCHNNQTLHNPADIAECFSEHFRDFPRSFHEHIQSVNNLPLHYVKRIGNSFENFPIAVSDVVRAFSKFKYKRCPINEVPSSLLKKMCGRNFTSCSLLVQSVNKFWRIP